MKVQSDFTYVIPAGTSTTPPAAPIRCACGDLILILKDRSLLKTVLRGVIRAAIRNVTVSKTPVPYVDPSNGSNYNVWKYDYTLEYDTNDLTDPEYRLRKCDIELNCCAGCAQTYTDRMIEGTVKSVTGNVVDNTDPENPVVTVAAETPNAVIDSASIDLTVSGALNRTIRADIVLSQDPDNNITVVNDGVFVPKPPVTPSYTEGPGIDINSGIISVETVNNAWSGQGFSCVDTNGTPVYVDSAGDLRTAPRHFTTANSLIVGGGANNTNGYTITSGNSVATDAVAGTVTVTNSSQCRQMLVEAFAIGRVFGQPVVGGTPMVSLLTAVGFNGDHLSPGSGYGLQQRIGTVVNANDRYDMAVPFNRVIIINPGATITVVFYARVQVVSGGSYTLNSGGAAAPVNCLGHVVGRTI